MEFDDTEVVEEEFLGAHHVADGDEGKQNAVRAAGFGVGRGRAGGPWQPPRTLAQTTKKRRVSTALPGPMRLFHQPGFCRQGCANRRSGDRR